MEKQKKRQNGITLIALVISIIVMLILAGVSLNMTIGENGIITQAQSATYMQSCAELEEFLNQYYVEHMADFESSESKVLSLINKKSDWFYVPAKRGIGGLNYVTDSDGNALYLIDKDGFENDNLGMKLKGGYAGNKTYNDYQSLNDVYGVTSDLHVYYSSGGKEVMIGVAKTELDKDLDTRKVFAKDSLMAKVLATLNYDSNGDGEIQASEVRNVKSLTLNQSDGISSLEDLYNLTSLEELKLSNLSLTSLDGIQNATQLCMVEFDSCNIVNYSALANVKKLEYLYLTNPNNNELKKLCDGLQNKDIPTLHYLGIFGENLLKSTNPSYLYAYNDTERRKISTLTDITPLNELSKVTKESILYLYLNCNSIKAEIAEDGTITQGLTPLANFKNIQVLHVYENPQLTTFKGLEGLKQLNTLWADASGFTSTEYLKDCTSLTTITIANSKLQNLKNINTTGVTSLRANNNQITSLSGLENSKITYLQLEDNTSLTSVKDIAASQFITQLYLARNTNMTYSEVSQLEDIIIRCGTNYSLPAQYSTCFDNTPRRDYTKTASTTLTDTSSTFASLSGKTTCTALNLKNQTGLTNQGLKDVLETMTGMQYLCLYGITNLTDISFVSNMPGLIELDLRGTSVTDLSVLENITTMRQLLIDNEQSNIDQIPKTISRCTGTKAGWSHNNIYYGDGLNLSGKQALYTKLGNITSKDFTKLVMKSNTGKITKDANNNVSTQVNLSGCSYLTTIYVQNCKNFDFYLPANLEIISFASLTGTHNVHVKSIAGISKVRELECFTAENTIMQELVNLTSGAPLLTTVNYRDYVGGAIQSNINWPACTSLSYINANGNSHNGVSSLTTLSTCNLPRLETLSLQWGRNLTSLEGIENLPALKTLNVYGCNLTSLKGISNCTQLQEINLGGSKTDKSYNHIIDISELATLTRLQKLTMSNNSVSSLISLQNLKALHTLDLTNNAIYDKSSYEVTKDDGTKETVEYYNMEVLANLNRNGALRTLYLSGNTGISDTASGYGFLRASGLTWNSACDW